MQENQLQIFKYNGSPITFNQGDNVMINATEMAKLFGKTPKDWLRTDASSEFINTLSAVRQICPSQLVIVQKGNSNSFEQGTWMHEDVALEFARWLSPAFSIWCNDRIKEILTNRFNPDLLLEMSKNIVQYKARIDSLLQDISSYSNAMRLIINVNKDEAGIHEKLNSIIGCLHELVRFYRPEVPDNAEVSKQMLSDILDELYCKNHAYNLSKQL